MKTDGGLPVLFIYSALCEFSPVKLQIYLITDYCPQGPVESHVIYGLICKYHFALG